jgi:hypothetical protein
MTGKALLTLPGDAWCPAGGANWKRQEEFAPRVSNVCGPAAHKTEVAPQCAARRRKPDSLAVVYH